MKTMGVLTHVESGRTVVLAAHSVAGRAMGCVVRLDDPLASNNHAAVQWTGERWEARDLGSSNGTFVNDVPVPLKQNMPLGLGASLRFGGEAERWALTDDAGPVVVARSVTTGEVCAATDGLLALPDPENIRVSVMLDSSGQWLVETSDGARRAARNAELIMVDGQMWELAVPPFSPVVGTYKATPSLKLATLTLRFQVSTDGEHVSLAAESNGHVVLLGERTCFGMLVHLARERRNDEVGATSSSGDEGWRYVADLVKDLNESEPNLNLMVFRTRRVFVDAGIEGAVSIIERRSGQLRIGVASGHLEEG